MKHIILMTLVLLYSISFSFSQEISLDEFVEQQQEKLTYEEEKLFNVPRTNVALIPPPHFEYEAQINGFVHLGSASTIQIIEVNGVSYKTIDNSMTIEHISSQGFEYIDRKETQLISGDQAVIYFVSFDADGIEFERAMLFTGDKHTIWVNFNYPLSMKKLLFPAVEAALLSVQPYSKK
jgi:hypothetical protein